MNKEFNEVNVGSPDKTKWNQMKPEIQQKKPVNRSHESNNGTKQKNPIVKWGKTTAKLNEIKIQKYLARKSVARLNKGGDASQT